MELLTTKRNISITTPLPPGTFAVDRMDGHEALGQLFNYDVSLSSPIWDLDLSRLLGQPVTVHCDLPWGRTRHFNGIVARAVHLDSDGEYARYGVTLRPWLWLLSLPSDCRIFQGSSVPELAKEVFRRAGFSDFEDHLSGTYPTLEYCVQYRESDFNFVSRLLEHEGIYYFFRHDANRHTLILADSHSGHVKQPGYELVDYKPTRSAVQGREHLSSWVVAQQLRPGAFAATDFDFERPRSPLLNALRNPRGDLHAEYEHFDYPGHYLSNEGGEARVKARLEAQQADHQLIQSSGDVRGLGAGVLFNLSDFPRPDQNKEYLVVRAGFAIHAGAYRSTTEIAEDEFRVDLTVLDSRVPFRQPLGTRKPRVEGPQTAIVCGKDGEEIWTDKYGRVMVKFHWDRYGAADDHASCWVRVAQMWAGARWGGIQIPRVGQEVVVDFLEGDPDRPIITGTVYNGNNLPPYDLTTNQTQSGIKTRSTPGGGPNNCNEIRFEDKQGSEELYVQAEKDHSVNVKHNQTISVAGDRTLKVTGNDSVSVSGNQTVAVSGTRSTTVTGKETETFSNAREMTVAATNTETITGKQTASYQGGRDETVDGADSLTVNGADKTTTVHGEYNVTADAQFEVQQGPNSILLKDQIKLNSAGAIQIINDNCSLDLRDGIATLWAADRIDLQCGGARISLMKDGTIEISGANKVMATAEGSATILNLEQAGATLTGDIVKIH